MTERNGRGLKEGGGGREKGGKEKESFQQNEMMLLSTSKMHHIHMLGWQETGNKTISHATAAPIRNDRTT